MLLVPFLLGLTVSGLDWVQLPLLVAWVLGYLATWAGGRWALSRFAARYRRPALAYLVALVGPALIVVLARPRLLLFAPIYLPLVAVMLWFSWRRDERNPINDVVAMFQSALMVLMAAVAAGGALLAGWPQLVVCLLYFLGTVPHVRSMIRGRDDPRWYQASVAWHVVALVAAVALHPVIGALFALLLGRAVALPRRPPTVMTIGLVEVAMSVLLVLVAAVAL